MIGLMSNSAKYPSMCMARYDTRTRAILERLEVRRWLSAKALKQPGSFDLSDHRL
jgi:hypothetical protein